MAAQIRQRLSPSRLFSGTPGFLVIGSVFFVVAAFFAVGFPDAPGRTWISLAATFLIAAPAFAATVSHLGILRGTLAVLTVGAFGYAIESFGVISGFPYGDFHYTDGMGGKLFGIVPYLLPVSYVPLVIGAVALCRTPGVSLSVLALRSALLLVLMDAVLDPGAAQLGLWVWESGGIYYGVPLGNYFGWLVSGFVASLLFALFLNGRRVHPAMLDGAILGLSFWLGVAIVSGFLIPALVGIALIAVLLRARLRISTAKDPSPHPYHSGADA